MKLLKITLLLISLIAGHTIYASHAQTGAAADIKPSEYDILLRQAVRNNDTNLAHKALKYGADANIVWPDSDKSTFIEAIEWADKNFQSDDLKADSDSNIHISEKHVLSMLWELNNTMIEFKIWLQANHQNFKSHEKAITRPEIRLLKAPLIDIKQKDNTGKTALAYVKNNEILKFMLEQKILKINHQASIESKENQQRQISYQTEDPIFSFEF